MVSLSYLRVADFRQLKCRLRLVSDHSLRHVLPSKMALVPLFHGFAVAVHDAVLVQLLFRGLLVELLSRSLSLLLHVGIHIHQFEWLLLPWVVLADETVVTSGR